MMLEMRESEGLKVRIKGIRLGLLASLVCKVSGECLVFVFVFVFV